MVSEVEVFGASKKYLHLKILAGKNEQNCGGHCGPEAAKNSRELLKSGCKAQPLCSRKCCCKALAYHVLDSVIVVEIANMNCCSNYIAFNHSKYIKSKQKSKQNIFAFISYFRVPICISHEN